MKRYFVIPAYIAVSCNINAARKDQPATYPVSKRTVTEKTQEVMKDNDNLKTRIQGAWTGGSTNDASFDIQTGSILYTDNLKSYKYALNNNTIKIYLDKDIYQGKISFKAETLVMTSKDGEVSKFWKFDH